MDVAVGAQEASMDVEIFSNTAGRWLPGRAVHLRSPAGQVLVHFELNGAEMRKRVPFPSPFCRKVVKEAGTPTAVDASSLQVDEGCAAEVEREAGTPSAVDASSLQVDEGSAAEVPQLPFAGAWARQGHPSTQVAEIQGHAIIWEGKDGPITTSLRVTGDTFSTTDSEGNTFRADLQGGQLIWEDSEVWVPLQPESPEAAPQQCSPPSPPDRGEDQAPLIGTLCMNGHHLQQCAAPVHECALCEGQPLGAAMRGCIQCDYAVCRECIGKCLGVGKVNNLVSCCMDGHELQSFVWEVTTCDVCGEGQKPGAAMRGCSECKYLVCSKCVGKASHPLLGPWKMIGIGFPCKVLNVNGQLCHIWKECPLHVEGRWLVAPFIGGKVRLRASVSGKAVTCQYWPFGAKDWTKSFYGTRDGLVAGTELLTTECGPLWHSVESVAEQPVHGHLGRRVRQGRGLRRPLLGRRHRGRWAAGGAGLAGRGRVAWWRWRRGRWRQEAVQRHSEQAAPEHGAEPTAESDDEAEGMVPVGLVAPGMRVVAAGPLSKSRTVPLLPHRHSVDFQNLRPLEAADDEDDDEGPATGDSSSAAARGGSSSSSSSSSSSYLRIGTLLDALAGGDTVLLRGSWLCEQSKRGAVLPRRQELPPEALWDPRELTPLLRRRRVQVVAVSYCWITPDHPDPKGDQLQILGSALGMRLAEETLQLEDLAVFLDWCSLHQKPRRPDQNVAFGKGLKAVNLWYAHVATTVFTLTTLPPECVQYNDRGWPFFERAVSSMLKDSSRLLDLGVQRSPTDWFSLADQCAQGRRPPLNPGAFAEALRLRTFTNKADHSFVNGKYRETYEQVLSHAQVLEFRKLTWGPEDAKVLAAALPDCGELRKLALSWTPVRAEGMMHLATSLPACLQLQELYLDGTALGDGGATALAAVLPRCPRLQLLDLQTNFIGGEGAARIAEALPSCPRLQAISLRGNIIGRRGVEALLAAIPACRGTGLGKILLESTGIEEADKQRLREAWKAAKEDMGDVYF